MDEVRKLRRDARGESLPGAEPDPVRASRGALLEWSERQLCSVDSEEHKHVVAFHGFFPQLCKMGKAGIVAPTVQKFMGEIADRLELDWLKEGRSPDGSELPPNLSLLEPSMQQAVVQMAVEAAITTPIAEPLLSAVKATDEQQQQQQESRGGDTVAAHLCRARARLV